MPETIIFEGMEIMEGNRQGIALSFKKGAEEIKRLMEPDTLLAAIEEYAKNHFIFPKEENSIL